MSHVHITDLRQSSGVAIRDMEPGTYFVTNQGLFVKASNEVCVDISTGQRVAWNELNEGQPVELNIQITRIESNG